MSMILRTKAILAVVSIVLVVMEGCVSVSKPIPVNVPKGVNIQEKSGKFVIKC